MDRIRTLLEFTEVMVREFTHFGTPNYTGSSFNIPGPLLDRMDFNKFSF